MRKPVDRFLSAFSSRPICFYRVPGNAGDALINAGTMAAFKRANVRWDAVEPGDDVSGRDLFVGGGGNLTPYYDHVSDALHRFVNSEPRRLVVLPHGIRGQEQVLKLLRTQDLVMCRDRPGYRHVRQTAHASVALAHDMAFHLDAPEFLDNPALSAVAVPFIEERLGAQGWSLATIAEQPVMRFMRIDEERCAATPNTDIDISNELIFGDVNAVSPVAAWSLLECVRHCQRVETDRLHVAIAAALVGIRAQLWPNNYNKNRSVFNQSVRRFDHVQFRSKISRQ